MFQKHKKEIALAVALITLFLLFWNEPSLAGGGFAIPWWTVDSGGGLSQGGSFVLNGTIGQSDAGFMSGSQYAFNGGFWNRSGSIIIPPEDLVFLPIVVR